MANWAYIENDVIKELHDLLPKNWRNISGFNLSENDTEYLRSLGWIKITKQHQTFDASIFKEIGHEHQFDGLQVIETNILEEKESDPTLEFNYIKSQFLNLLREKRNILLQNCDWTQLNDNQNRLSEEDKIYWLNYRQYLRDLPSDYEQNELVDLNGVDWNFTSNTQTGN
jgi:hypothetical protein